MKHDRRKSVRLLALAAMVIGAAFLLMECTPEGAWDIVIRELQPDPWQEPDQKYRMRLAFDNEEGTEDLDDFPLLVVLNSSRVDYSEFQAGGADIRFYDEDTGLQLDHEVEYWDTSGESIVWVKVPRIRAGTQFDYIWMYYGDSTAGDTQDPGGLWSDYRLVYHFSDDPGNTVYDSTANGNDGTSEIDGAAGAPLLVSARVGLGLQCTSAPSKRYVDTDYREDLGNWTIEAWIKADEAPFLNAAGGFANGPLMGGQVYNIGWDHNGDTYLGAIQVRDSVTSWQAVKLGTLEGGTWYHLAGVYDSSAPSITAYNNGEPVGDPFTNLSGTLSATAYDVYIGVENNENNPVDGIVDEVRISALVRSDEYIKAQYRSMTDSFIVYYDPEEVD